MGVDYYTCQNCQRNFPDCGYYFTCTGCENSFCSNKCGGKQVEEESADGLSYNDLTSCVLCREEVITDADLLAFILEHFKITHQQAMEMYRARD